MLKCFILLCFSSVSVAAPFQRLDPHGQSNLVIKNVHSLQGYSECTVCHLDQKGKIRTKPSISKVCSDCHNRAPHGGVADHAQKGVSCTGCHAVHRSGAPFNHMIVKACTDCHKPRQIKAKFPHDKHSSLFGEMGLTCVQCHSFRTKSVDPTPLGQTIGKGELKVSSSVCQHCHGVKPSTAFINQCLSCHDDKSGGTLNHPIKTGMSCQLCHNPTGFSHRSWAFKETAKCLECHQNKNFHHRAVTSVSELDRAKNVKLPKNGIHCLTCHQMHGSRPQEKTLAFCASCHGPKADSLYKHFHDKMK